MYDCKEALRRIDAVIAAGAVYGHHGNRCRIGSRRNGTGMRSSAFLSHWGVYSVPAFENEWYPRNMYIEGSKVFEHHAKTYGAHKDFGYKDFIPLFKAEKFDPAAWAALFKRAGARYVVPVAEHHDGFQMYKSALALERRRDGAAARRCRRAEGRRGGRGDDARRFLPPHRALVLHGRRQEFRERHPAEPGPRRSVLALDGVSPDTDDLFGAPGPDAEFLDDWLVRTCESIDSYRPRILYFDWVDSAREREAVPQKARRLLLQPRRGSGAWRSRSTTSTTAFLFGTAVPDIERGQMADIKPYFWQTDTAIALNSWCYTENNDFRPAEDILCDLVDIVSKNGCLLLNVGPKADGTISDEDTAVLTAIGGWMAVNGEAIYGTHVWKTFGEVRRRCRTAIFPTRSRRTSRARISASRRRATSCTPQR